MASYKPEGSERKREAVDLKAGDSLGFLIEHPELDVPSEISDLIRSLETNIKLLKTKIQELQQRLTPEDSSLQAEIFKRELKIEDFTRMIRQLFQFAQDSEVIEAARAMNAIYSRRTQNESQSDDFLDSFRKLLERKKPVTKAEYVSAEERLDDTLDASQTKRIGQLANIGDRDALLETYAVTLDRYTELTDKILKLPKSERDGNIDILMTTLNLYDSLTNGEYQQKVAESMAQRAREIFENQKANFEGIRGMIQKGTEKAIDVAVDIIGGNEGLSRTVAIAAGKVGKNIMKPLVFDETLVRSIEEEVKKQIAEIGSVVDADAINAIRQACVNLKANPDNMLAEKDKEEFMKAFRRFVPATTAVMKKIIDTQIDLIQYDFPLARGEKTSEFSADSEGRAKFMQIKGRDICRLMQMYSPFGILLPESVDREEGKEPVHVRSAYDMGWFKEHPLFSTGLQAVELAALLRLMPGFARLSMKLGYHLAPIPGKSIARRGLKTIGNIIGKRVGQGVISGPLNIAFAVYTGVEVVDELKEIHLTAVEENIMKIIEKYTSLRDISQEDGEKIRILTLRNELEKRRGALQEIGVNLGETGISIIDRLSLGNMLGGLSPRADMKQTGKLREAFLEANRKLVILGLRPFVMP